MYEAPSMCQIVKSLECQPKTVYPNLVGSGEHWKIGWWASECHSQGHAYKDAFGAGPRKERGREPADGRDGEVTAILYMGKNTFNQLVFGV